MERIRLAEDAQRRAERLLEQERAAEKAQVARIAAIERQEKEDAARQEARRRQELTTAERERRLAAEEAARAAKVYPWHPKLDPNPDRHFRHRRSRMPSRPRMRGYWRKKNKKTSRLSY